MSMAKKTCNNDTVDGRHPANQLITRVLVTELSQETRLQAMLVEKLQEHLPFNEKELRWTGGCVDILNLALVEPHIW